MRPQSGQACPCRRKPATVIFTSSGRTTGFRWDTVLGPFSAVRATFAHIRKTGSITLVAGLVGQPASPGRDGEPNGRPTSDAVR